MAYQAVSRDSNPANIQKFTVISNEGTNYASLLGKGSLSTLMYFESIMLDTIKIEYTFIDSGHTIDNKTAVEGLPIVGEERVLVKFSDNYENELDLTMYINKVTPITEDSIKSMYKFELTSREYILNEKIRINSRFDGKISEHIKTIFTSPDFFGTEKNLDIEETNNNYNFIGGNKKGFYCTNFLSTRSVSASGDFYGKTAGFFFFETSEGYKFKSIDTLLGQEKKRSYIYNNTSDARGDKIPEGYDGKILEFSKDYRTDIQEKLKMGAYSTRTISFDPFNCYYAVSTHKATDNEESMNTAAKNLPKLNPEFNRPGSNKEFSRTTYYLVDRGAIPTGSTETQLEKATELNFDSQNILNQAIMRYNQLFAAQVVITIPGDFSLHAGDAIFIGLPDITSEDEIISNKDSGLYIIADLCHLVSATGTFTKLVLVRDSFGKKGTFTSGR